MQIDVPELLLDRIEAAAGNVGMTADRFVSDIFHRYQALTDDQLTMHVRLADAQLRQTARSLEWLSAIEVMLDNIPI